MIIAGPAGNAYLEAGPIDPPVADLKKVSLVVAARVPDKALEEGCANRRDLIGMDLEAYVKANARQARHLGFKSVGPVSEG